MWRPVSDDRAYSQRSTLAHRDRDTDANRDFNAESDTHTAPGADCDAKANGNANTQRLHPCPRHQACLHHRHQVSGDLATVGEPDLRF